MALSPRPLRKRNSTPSFTASRFGLRSSHHPRQYRGKSSFDLQWAVVSEAVDFFWSGLVTSLRTKPGKRLRVHATKGRKGRKDNVSVLGDEMV
jgi:hypothetical protein